LWFIGVPGADFSGPGKAEEGVTSFDLMGDVVKKSQRYSLPRGLIHGGSSFPVIYLV
jgi:hypothetical protein